MAHTFVTLVHRNRCFALGVRDIDTSFGIPMDSLYASELASAICADPANWQITTNFLYAHGMLDPGPYSIQKILRKIIDAIQRGTLVLIDFARHQSLPFVLKKDGSLTLSEVSWGETAGLYPTKTTSPSEREKMQPSTWDDHKLYQLQKARAAIHEVAKRNPVVHKSAKFTKQTNLYRPYHCIENFPNLDREIDQTVRWFYISNQKDRPSVHPGTTGTKLVKSYGEFFCNGGGDVKRGAAYVLFYKPA